ncbi:MAG TPA: hypothetical protein P5205_16990 [Candidatus Paceibacterota bacterium]|nr:hypothetical protein [Verrucomicrobiota bacterium]HSA12060.1 hypothetical protein [Candidatus Paceibacterota bacterium]
MTSTEKAGDGVQPVTVEEKLLAIREGGGFEVHTGWNSHHLGNWPHAADTYLKKDGRLLNAGGGRSCSAGPGLLRPCQAVED